MQSAWYDPHGSHEYDQTYEIAIQLMICTARGVWFIHIIEVGL